MRVSIGDLSISYVGQDAKTLVVQPWEKNMLDPIEKAIIGANLGVTPQNNGELIRLVMPPLTEERRKQLVKKLGELAETAKVSIRNARKWANDLVKDLVKDGLPEDAGKTAETKVQDLTNEFSEKVDKFTKAKEVEITSELNTFPYGVRDFQIKDIDGNLLCFGCPA